MPLSEISGLLSSSFSLIPTTARPFDHPGSGLPHGLHRSVVWRRQLRLQLVDGGYGNQCPLSELQLQRNQPGEQHSSCERSSVALPPGIGRGAARHSNLLVSTPAASPAFCRVRRRRRKTRSPGEWCPPLRAASDTRLVESRLPHSTTDPARWTGRTAAPFRLRRPCAPPSGFSAGRRGRRPFWSRSSETSLSLIAINHAQRACESPPPQAARAMFTGAHTLVRWRRLELLQRGYSLATNRAAGARAERLPTGGPQFLSLAQ